MAKVELTDGEWQAVITILSTAAWRDANPLLMKIGQQLQAQQTTPHAQPPSVNQQANGGETLAR